DVCSCACPRFVLKMSQDPKQDKEAMKKTWTDETNVAALQKQGIAMTLLMWRERHRADMLSKQKEECLDTIDNLQMLRDRSDDHAQVTLGNLRTLCDSILKLSVKEDGTPLNNEMTQVVNLVHMINDKQTSDIESLKEQYLAQLKNVYENKKNTKKKNQK
ncbi:MAG: hypothetical protein ACPG2Y_03405, partial [Acholeplasmataceae bacterium]